MSKISTKTAGGLKFKRHFTKEGVKPEDMFNYEFRTSVIKNPDGGIVFKMDNVEVPDSWSQVATDILAQKYCRKAGVPMPDGSTGSEASIKQVAHRMANCWKEWGEKYNYFATPKDAQIFYEELDLVFAFFRITFEQIDRFLTIEFFLQVFNNKSGLRFALFKRDQLVLNGFLFLSKFL